MLGNPGGTGGHGPEVAGELVLVSAGNRRVAVSSEELVEVAVDPHISHLLVALLEDQPREPAAQCSGDIVPQVWTRGLWSEPIRSRASSRSSIEAPSAQRPRCSRSVRPNM